MIGALAQLLMFQLFGEIVVGIFDLPLPGPVVGMLLLFVTLLVRGSISPTLKETSQGLLRQLGLLFVPAGVGIITYFPLIQQEWLPIVATLIGSTLLTLGITALTMCFFVRRTGKTT